MRNANFAILSGSDAATLTGGKVDAGQYVSASFQSVFGDTTAAGTVTIQGSNDECLAGNVASTFTPTNWSVITGASSTITAGVGPMILIPNMSFRWVRAVFTSSVAGNSTVVVNMNALAI